MPDYTQSTFYFNNINSIIINKKDYNLLNSLNWETKIIVLKTQVYYLDFLSYNNEYYLKTIYDYSTNEYYSLFGFNIINWFNKGKIIKIVNYS